METIGILGATLGAAIAVVGAAYGISKIAKKYHGSVNTYYFDEDQTFHTIVTMKI